MHNSSSACLHPVSLLLSAAAVGGLLFCIVQAIQRSGSWRKTWFKLQPKATRQQQDTEPQDTKQQQQQKGHSRPPSAQSQACQESSAATLSPQVSAAALFDDVDSNRGGDDAAVSVAVNLGQLTGAIAAAGKLLEHKQGLPRQQLKVPLRSPSSAVTRAAPVLLQHEVLDLLSCCLVELAGQSKVSAAGSDAAACGDQLTHGAVTTSESGSSGPTAVDKLCNKLLALSKQHMVEVSDSSSVGSHSNHKSVA